MLISRMALNNQKTNSKSGTKVATKNGKPVEKNIGFGYQNQVASKNNVAQSTNIQKPKLTPLQAERKAKEDRLAKANPAMYKQYVAVRENRKTSDPGNRIALMANMLNHGKAIGKAQSDSTDLSVWHKGVNAIWKAHQAHQDDLQTLLKPVEAARKYGSEHILAPIARKAGELSGKAAEAGVGFVGTNAQQARQFLANKGIVRQMSAKEQAHFDNMISNVKTKAGEVTSGFVKPILNPLDQDGIKFMTKPGDAARIMGEGIDEGGFEGYKKFTNVPIQMVLSADAMGGLLKSGKNLIKGGKNLIVKGGKTVISKKATSGIAHEMLPKPRNLPSKSPLLPTSGTTVSPIAKPIPNAPISRTEINPLPYVKPLPRTAKAVNKKVHAVKKSADTLENSKTVSPRKSKNLVDSRTSPAIQENVGKAVGKSGTVSVKTIKTGIPPNNKQVVNSVKTTSSNVALPATGSIPSQPPNPQVVRPPISKPPISQSIPGAAKPDTFREHAKEFGKKVVEKGAEKGVEKGVDWIFGDKKEEKKKKEQKKNRSKNTVASRAGWISNLAAAHRQLIGTELG